jgi:hypothetical protein
VVRAVLGNDMKRHPMATWRSGAAARVPKTTGTPHHKRSKARASGAGGDWVGMLRVTDE